MQDVDTRHWSRKWPLTEHWTDSHQVLVLDGSPDVVESIAVALSLPVARIILLTPGRAVLGLWGDSLILYVSYRGPRQTDRDRNYLLPRARQNVSFECCN